MSGPPSPLLPTRTNPAAGGAANRSTVSTPYAHRFHASHVLDESERRARVPAAATIIVAVATRVAIRVAAAVSTHATFAAVVAVVATTTVVPAACCALDDGMPNYKSGVECATRGILSDSSLIYTKTNTSSCDHFPRSLVGRCASLYLRRCIAASAKASCEKNSTSPVML